MIVALLLLTLFQSEKKALHELLLSVSNQFNYEIYAHGETASYIKPVYQGDTLEEYLNRYLSGTPFFYELVTEKRQIFIKKRVHLAGFIKDRETGEAIIQAEINVLGKAGITTFTNSLGYFSLSGNFARDDSLQIQSVGYYAQKFSARELEELNEINLKPYVYSGEQILVDGEFQGNINVPFFGESDALIRLAKSSNSHSGTALFYRFKIRGANDADNLILLDGMTLYHHRHFLGSLSAFNSNALIYSNLIKSDINASYGERVAGVIELAGRRGKNENGQLYGQLSELSWNLSYDKKINQFSWFLSFRKSISGLFRSGLYQKTIDEFQKRTNFFLKDSSQNRLDLSFYDLQTKMTYEPDDKNVITWSLYHGADEVDHVIGDSSVFSDIRYWGNIATSLDWFRVWNKRFQSSAFYSYSRYFSDNESVFDRLSADTKTNNIRSSFKNGFENTVVEHKFKLETNFRYKENVLSIGTEFKSLETVYKLLLITDDTPTVVSPEKHAFTSVFYLNQIFQFQFLEATIGGRMVHHSLTETHSFQPRIHLSTQRLDHTFYSGYGTFRQFVTRLNHKRVPTTQSQVWVVADNKYIFPMGSEHVYSGYRFKGIFDFRVEVYKKWFRNQLFSLSSITDVFEYKFHYGNVNTNGVEISYKQLFGEFLIGLDYTWETAKYNSSGWNGNTPVVVDHQREHQFNLNVYYPSRWGKWGVRSYIATGEPYNIPQSDGTFLRQEFLGNSYQTDVSFEKWWDINTVRIKAEFSVKNIFSEKRIDEVSYYKKDDQLMRVNHYSLGLYPSVQLSVMY